MLEVLQRGRGRSPKDLFEALGELATDRNWPVGTEAGYQVLQRGDDAIRRFEHDQRLVAAGVLGEELAARRARPWQEPEEAEGVRRQARRYQGGNGRRGARHGHDLVAGRQGIANEGKTGVRDTGCTGVTSPARHVAILQSLDESAAARG